MRADLASHVRGGLDVEAPCHLIRLRRCRRRVLPGSLDVRRMAGVTLYSFQRHVPSKYQVTGRFHLVVCRTPGGQM